MAHDEEAFGDSKVRLQFCNPADRVLTTFPTRDDFALQVLGYSLRVLVGRGVPRFLHLAQLISDLGDHEGEGQRSGFAGSALWTRPHGRAGRSFRHARSQHPCIVPALFGQWPLGSRRLSVHCGFGVSNENHWQCHRAILARPERDRLSHAVLSVAVCLRSLPARGAPLRPWVSCRNHEEDFQWLRTTPTEKKSPFSSMSKRRRGFPSESRVKRGDRVVHGNKELIREAWSQRSMSVWVGPPVSRTVA